MAEQAAAPDRECTFPPRRPRLRRLLMWSTLAWAITLAFVLGASLLLRPLDAFVAGPAIPGDIEPPNGRRFTRTEHHVLIGHALIVYDRMTVYTWASPFTDPSSVLTSHELAKYTTFESGQLSNLGLGALFWPPASVRSELLRGNFDLVAIPLTWPTLASLAAFLILFRRHRRLSKQGHCLKCTYDTRHLDLRCPCPECGGWTRIA